MADPMFNVLPTELPDTARVVAWDTETSGLYPDSGARVSVVSVAWYEGERIRSYAWPFNQGLYGKPELEKAYFGQQKLDEPLLDEEGQPVRFKTGARKGEIKTRKTKRLLTAADVLEPDYNLDRRYWDALIEWLLSRRGLVAHNALFDIIMTSAGVGRAGDPWPGPETLELLDKTVWCTLIGQKVLDPQFPLGLKETSDRLWGQTADEQFALKEHLKSRRLPPKRYDLADWSIMEPYAVGDTERCIRLARHQWRRMRDSSKTRFEQMDFETEVMRTLVRMEHRGLPYNAQQSLEWAGKLSARLEELGSELPFEPTDSGARSFFFGAGYVERVLPDKSGSIRTPALGLTPIKVTEKTRQACVDAEVMQRLVDQDVPHAHRFQEFGLVSDAVSRYYSGYALAVGPDGRLRTRFRQWTSTNRTSCERVNLQAIPHDHRLLAAGSEILAEAPSPRALIEEPEGWVLWHMDLAQAELRGASQFARCQPMIDIFAEGRDPHGETAISLGLATGPQDPGWFKARSVIGKRANFSLIFGIGHEKFRADVRKQSGLDLESPDHVCYTPRPGFKGRACTAKTCKVKKLVDDWRQLYPEFGQAIDVHSRMAQRDGWTLIRGGWRKWYTDLEKKLFAYHKAFNNKVQGNVGLLTKTWAIEADRLCMEQGIDPDFGGLLLNVHDALEILLPVGYDWLAEQCAQIGRDLWSQWFTVPGGVDLSRWHKEG